MRAEIDAICQAAGQPASVAEALANTWKSLQAFAALTIEQIKELTSLPLLGAGALNHEASMRLQAVRAVAEESARAEAERKAAEEFALLARREEVARSDVECAPSSRAHNSRQPNHLLQLFLVSPFPSC